MNSFARPFRRILLCSIALIGLESGGQEAGSLSVEVAEKQIYVNYLLPGPNISWNTVYTVSGVEPAVTTTFPGFVGFISRLNPVNDTKIRYKKFVEQQTTTVNGIPTAPSTRSFTYVGPGQWEDKMVNPDGTVAWLHTIPSVQSIGVQSIYDLMEGAPPTTETRIDHWVYYVSVDYDGTITEYILDRTLSEPVEPTTTGGAPYSFSYPTNEIPSAQRSGSSVVSTVYNLTVPQGMTGTVHWFEIFSPAADPERKQYTPREWTISGAVTTSPDFLLEAAADGNSAVVLYDPPQLAVDANRDGAIKLAGEDASDTTAAEKPYRFWVNDDNDNGQEIDGEDTPGSSTPDGQQVKVQGTRDLVDFFPVFLDLKQFLAVLPPSASVRYKLKNADDGLRFVYTNLNRANAFKYLKDSATGNSLKEADAHWLLSSGYDLDPTWLGQVRDEDKGVILVEGRNATDTPLVLSVEKADGSVIAEAQLELKIVPVEMMFRHLNLHDRNLPGLVGAMPGGTAQPEAMGDPTGFPDNPNSDSRWLIFVHGFNVSGQGGRGWNAEMFKRCYWSGNKSRFVGVSWFGNPDQVLGVISDYHLAVRNAMVTAPVLAQEINALTGAVAAKTVFTHSLGCGIVSSAIADHGMNIGRVCFIDAALALECFDGRSPGTFTAENDGMTPAAWKPYDPKLYAANWSALFDPATDERALLTWNNRFTRTGNGQKDVSAFVYHFYSSTEDILADYTGELPSTLGGVIWAPGHVGTFGWVFQEKGKGNRQDYGLVSGLTHLGSSYGGWGFNLTDPAAPTDPTYYFADGSVFGGGQRAPSTTVTGSDASNWQAQFRRAPLFDPGYGPTSGTVRWIDPSVLRGPTWIPQLYDTTSDTTTGSGVAAVAANRAQLLAEAIPSLTWCMGSHFTFRFGDTRNFNLPSLVDQTNWPRGRPDKVTPEWRHSDMREVAYLYQYGVFDKIVELSKP